MMEAIPNELWSQHHILTTKLRIPTLAGGIVKRPRLYALLDQALCRLLTMLSAPPGFGKTTLVADWLRQTQADSLYAWVSLTGHDNQPGTFWSYVFAAVDDAVLDGTHQFAELLNTSRRNGLEAALIQWLNMQNERAEPLILVIDNYQYITAPEVNESLAFVLEHLPKQVHVILLTNHEPRLPLPRWRARGLVTEIRADELSYTTDEASAFLAMNEPRCPSGESAPLIRHAEGWFAGLRLISAAWKQANHMPDVFVEASGSYVYEYVQNEVLADLPAEIRVFLLHTCVVDEMCAELCDAVLHTGERAGAPPSQHMLRKLERLNLFIVPLDVPRRWYRYHQLFRKALRYLLLLEEPELVGALLHRASAWYVSHHQLDMAIEYALRGKSWERAASLIKQWLHEAAQQRQSDRLRRADAWIAQLPGDVAQEQQSIVGLHLPKRQNVLAKPSEALLEWEVDAPSPFTYTPSLPITQHMWSDAGVQGLTTREHEVLMLIAEGASNYEIADKLVLSLHTVKRHASNIFAKLNAANRTQAVAYARAYGVLSRGHDLNYHVHA